MGGGYCRNWHCIVEEDALSTLGACCLLPLDGSFILSLLNQSIKYQSHDLAQQARCDQVLCKLREGGRPAPSYYIAQLCYPIAEIDWTALRVDE